MMNQIQIGPGGRFSLGGENFVIEGAVPAEDRCPSTSEAFTILKSEPYLRVYEDIASGFSPRSILELGIFQGGSYVFLDKLFKPRRMSAVEINPEPVPPLLQYVSGTENRFVHFATSQHDGEMLKQIVPHELADELDLVVDDASHTYEETKTSFEFLFPLLRPGGIYVIEDWSWAHHPNYQSPDARFSERHALSNLLFEQIMLLGSTSVISEIRVWRFLYLICKAKGAVRRTDASRNFEFDSTVPETDFSANSFEGIRSEEIEPLLSRYFDPVEMWRRNCFLWRLVNPADFHNYDLNNQEDRYLVLSLVAAEYNLWKSGGRPTESHSVYRKR